MQQILNIDGLYEIGSLILSDERGTPITAAHCIFLRDGAVFGPNICILILLQQIRSRVNANPRRTSEPGASQTLFNILYGHFKSPLGL